MEGIRVQSNQWAKCAALNFNSGKATGPLNSRLRRIRHKTRQTLQRLPLKLSNRYFTSVHFQMARPLYPTEHRRYKSMEIYSFD